MKLLKIVLVLLQFVIKEINISTMIHTMAGNVIYGTSTTTATFYQQLVPVSTLYKYTQEQSFINVSHTESLGH